MELREERYGGGKREAGKTVSDRSYNASRGGRKRISLNRQEGCRTVIAVICVKLCRKTLMFM